MDGQIKIIMTYYNPEKQIPIVIDNCKELFNAMKTQKVKIQDLEKVWVDLFKQDELYEGSHIVQCLRMFYESAIIALKEVDRKDFSERQKEIEFKKELSYEEAAAYLGISKGTITRRIADRKLFPKRYNRKNTKISIGELERYKTSACGVDLV